MESTCKASAHPSRPQSNIQMCSRITRQTPRRGRSSFPGERDTEQHRQEQRESRRRTRGKMGLGARTAVWLVVVAEPRNPTPTSITTRASERGKQPDRAGEVSANNLKAQRASDPSPLEQKNVMAPFPSSPRFPSRIFLSFYRLPVCPHAASVPTPDSQRPRDPRVRVSP